MRVLAVDPGLTRCGIGVVSGAPGKSLSLVHVEVATTPAELELSRRLLEIDRRVQLAMDEFAPDAVVVERVFSQHNLRSVMGVAQISGVVMVNAARRGLPVAMHTPTEVKAAVTGSGSASKQQVATMVNRLLRARVDGPADATDALALAICHIWKGATHSRLAAATSNGAKS